MTIQVAVVGEMLFVQAPTLDLNPTFDQQAIETAYLEDPVSAAAEYGAQFRDLAGALLSRVILERYLRPDEAVTVDPTIHYALAVDVASGSGEDGFGVAVAHAVHEAGHSHVVVDWADETRPPFAPTDLIADVAKLAEDLKTTTVYGDRASFGWVLEEFKPWRLAYEPVGSTTSENYLTFLSLLNSGRLSLPPNETLVRQLSSLQRRVTATGHEAIDHPRGAHDDVAAATAAAVAVAYRGVAERPTLEVW